MKLSKSPVSPKAMAPEVLSATRPPAPWGAIWLYPRRTLRELLGTRPTYWVWPLAMAGGVLQMLDFAILQSLGESLPVSLVLLTVLVAGACIGMVSLLAMAAMLHLSGRLLGGRANFRAMRAALAWSNAPAFPVLGAFLLALPFVWQTVFTGAPAANLLERTALGLFWVTRMLALPWSVFLLIQNVAEAQRFPALWAILSLLLALGALFLLALTIPVASLLIMSLIGYGGY